MGKYVEQNLNRGESIVKKADLNPIMLVFTWLFGILFCWLLLVPLVKAIIATVKFCNVELAVTNKRVVGKVGVFNTQTLDAPLNKVQNASTKGTFWGKIFNYATVTVNTAAGEYKFAGIKNADAFKGIIMNQIEAYEEQRMKDQAQQMATAMASAINK